MSEATNSRLTFWLILASVAAIFWLRLGITQILDQDVQYDLRTLALERQTSIEAVNYAPVFYMESELPGWEGAPDEVCEDRDPGPAYVWECYDAAAIESEQRWGRIIALNYIFVPALAAALGWLLANRKPGLALVGVGLAVGLAPLLARFFALLAN